MEEVTSGPVKEKTKAEERFDYLYRMVIDEGVHGTRDMTFQSEEDIKEVEDRYRHLSEWGAKKTLYEYEEFVSDLYRYISNEHRKDFK